VDCPCIVRRWFRYRKSHPVERRSLAKITLIPLSQTVAAIYAFFKAMTLYPHVAVKAQAEIDSVVGSERLPSFSDREDLPYVNALVLEVMRWHPVGPIGIKINLFQRISSGSSEVLHRCSPRRRGRRYARRVPNSEGCHGYCKYLVGRFSYYWHVLGWIDTGLWILGKCCMTQDTTRIPWLSIQIASLGLILN
jgi:hypothetical protein